MPVFSFSILIGVEEKHQKYVNAELMIYIVKSKSQSDYAEHLSSELECWDNEGKTVSVSDNKNLHDEDEDISTFEGIGLKSYSSDFGEIKSLDPEVDFDVSEEIFSKTMRFKDSQAYYEFASASSPDSFHDVGMYSNPDRYFFWAIE